MKKVLTILLLSTYIFSTTELYQLLKIPVLIEHFFEHKDKQPEMSVLDFLALHYNGHHLENHPHDDDYAKDQKLPFMAHANVLSIYCIHTPPFLFEVKNNIHQTRKLKMPAFDEKFTDNNFLSAIWQPPKSC